MSKGIVQIYYGEGHGKTTAAFGNAIRAASEGKSVIIIQFLKGKNENVLNFLGRLEPEIKVFRFEKSEKSFECLTEEEQMKERQNLQNGMNFARKVLATEGCDVLILDEILGLLEYGIVTKEEIASLLQANEGGIEIILTGIYQGKEVWDMADRVTEMVTRSKG